jgi:hypothetical protein
VDSLERYNEGVLVGVGLILEENVFVKEIETYFGAAHLQ